MASRSGHADPRRGPALGPPWFPRKQDFMVKQGDTLEVTGSKVTRDDQTWLLATQVKNGEQTLKVRDENGKPLWRRHEPGGAGPEAWARGVWALTAEATEPSGQ
jgi:hypothetical protein